MAVESLDLLYALGRRSNASQPALAGFKATNATTVGTIASKKPPSARPPPERIGHQKSQEDRHADLTNEDRSRAAPSPSQIVSSLSRTIPRTRRNVERISKLMNGISVMNV